MRYLPMALLVLATFVKHPLIREDVGSILWSVLLFATFVVAYESRSILINK